jgi:LemA protein
MTASFVMAFLAAVALFWAIGAYNRLVRLRAEVVKAFSVLDNVLSVQPALIQASIPMPGMPTTGAEQPPLPWDRLGAAGEQYARALANARAQPLDPHAIATLSAAQDVLDGVWQSAALQASDNVPAALPDGLEMRLARLADQAVVPGQLFDASVQTYNAAIRQFPALLLALVWGFKPAATLNAQRTDGSPMLNVEP